MLDTTGTYIGFVKELSGAIKGGTPDESRF